MITSRVTHDGPGEADLRYFKLYKVLVTEGRNTLYLIFLWGCNRDLTKSLKQNLIDKGLTKRDFKNMFRDSTMRDKIDSNPSGDEFDIALLYACIENTCINLAPKGQDDWIAGDNTKLESVCKSIKNFRNEFIHSPPSIPDDGEMNTILQKLQEHLENAIKLGGDYYGRQSEVDNNIQLMRDNIAKIMNSVSLDIDSIHRYQNELKELRSKQKNIVCETGKNELFSKYKNLSKVDPASFISGRNTLQVSKVFTRLEVARNQVNNASYSEDVDYETLLELRTEDGSMPVITLVEGEAGAGKTTLAKLILDKWMSLKTSGISHTFHGLHNYDLVLYTEARNRNISSFIALLSVLMSQASYNLHDEDLLRSVLDLKVLLILDGLDELNTASKKLLKELFDKHVPRSNGKLRLLITTRPNMLPEIPSLLHNQLRVHTRLKGITQENRVEFIRKLHEEMINNKQSIQSTEKLVDFMKQSETRLSEHFRLPLNLTLLTYLWASDPDHVNSLTTATDLYISLNKLIKSRLLTRLKENNGVVTLPSDKLEEKCDEFLKTLYQVSLETHSLGHIQLSFESTKILRDKCKELELPCDDMFSAFLAVENEWTAYGYKSDLFVPHKSIMEFYAANKILFYLTENNDEEAVQKAVQDMGQKLNVSQEMLESFQASILKEKKTHKSLKDAMKNLGIDLNSVKLSDYQNVFLHLSGLLAHKYSTVLEKYAEELVDLLKNAKLKEAQWLDLVVETKCDDKMAALIAHEIKLQLVVRDGHTGAALKMFDYLEPNVPVQIILENEVRYIPQLNELLDDLSRRECFVQLILKHQWKHNQYGTSDSLLQRLVNETGNSECRVSHFTGNLRSLAEIPVTITHLRITLVNDKQATVICEELIRLVKKQKLDYLGVHVMKEVSPKALIPLPVVKAKVNECGTLWLSDVKDDQVDKACVVIRALLPPQGQYQSIMFPRSSIHVNKCEELLSELARLEVRVKDKGGIRLSSPAIDNNRLYELKELAHQKLNCEFYCSDELSMW
ncbi:hypothetical protein OTU49_017420 [Cherax quadricarinatus]|uniref:NACHT domain-containing protein n=2 Tax=Cherax quadricarinatus TaxID=27406 RepID=A0AAW0X3X1_CHEQU